MRGLNMPVSPTVKGADRVEKSGRYGLGKL